MTIAPELFFVKAQALVGLWKKKNRP